jgi:RNA polymerase sigma-70 factor (ECF subfamily)
MAHEKQNEAFLEDDAIVELYWERNEKAISETDKKYGRYLYTIAYNILHERLDCEECLNDTYLGTWNTIPPTRPTAFQVFISKIARNVAVDKYRERSANKRIPSEMIVSLDEIGDAITYDESIEESEAFKVVVGILNDYLKSVDAQKQLMFVCRYYYFDKVDDIASMMGLSSRSVFRTLAAMREELKERLQKEGISV